MNLSLTVVLLVVLAAEFANGLTDAPNAIATVISTRVLSPFVAGVLGTAVWGMQNSGNYLKSSLSMLRLDVQ